MEKQKVKVRRKTRNRTRVVESDVFDSRTATGSKVSGLAFIAHA